MKHLFGAMILSALIGTASAEDSNRTDSIVFIDAWWSLDYAKNSCWQVTQWHQENRDLIKQLGCNAVTSCQELMPRVDACGNDPGPEVLYFFAQLAAQLASNTQCKGVQVTKYDGPNSATSSEAANTMTKPHSTLIVDYTPGSPKQAWTLSQRDTHMDGEGDPKEIAANICTIVTERGARFVK
ncbi:MAG: hypothetical protein ACR2KT_09205 [Methylocella sp.]